MGFIGLIKWVCIFCLLWAMDWQKFGSFFAEEPLADGQADGDFALREREGEFEMEQDQVVSQQPLGGSSFAVVYSDGGVTINDESMGLVALSASEAYALLDVLYRHMDLLRQKRDEPHLRLLTEQEMEELAARMPDLPRLARE